MTAPPPAEPPARPRQAGKRRLAGAFMALVTAVRAPEILAEGGWRRWTLIAAGLLAATLWSAPAIAGAATSRRRRNQQ